jgi:hypothetical protein
VFFLGKRGVTGREWVKVRGEMREVGFLLLLSFVRWYDIEE